MIKSEIVSPAGNFEKLKFAVLYGADWVYFGGEEFNLRIQAGNFSNEDIKKSIAFCKSHGVKTLFLLNSFLHEKDITLAREYINRIKDLDFDAIMVADPSMLMLLKEAGVKTEFHLSTQMSTLNHLSIKFWSEIGFSRIVLGRETTLDEIKMIRENTNIEVEIFAHGALCIAYSGRCLLSRYLSGRDANQGDCSQPCRWKYSLLEEKRPGNYMDIIEWGKQGETITSGTEILSSKDLSLINRVRYYAKAGINAFKIEGRMKSLYHTANTTRIYKHALKLVNSPHYDKFLPFWNEELDLINHRPYTDDLFNEFGNLGFEGVPYIKKVMFLGYKTDENSIDKKIRVKIFNPIYKDETISAIFPIDKEIKDDDFIVTEITDSAGNSSRLARPGEIYTITFNKPVDDFAIFRRKLLED